MNNVKVSTLDELRKAAAITKQPSFADMSLSDRFNLLVQAAASDAEEQSDDSSRFSTFVQRLTLMLSLSDYPGGTLFYFAHFGDRYVVTNGDTSNITYGFAAVNGRLYEAATTSPSNR
jgi:hypothetical protein